MSADSSSSKESAQVAAPRPAASLVESIFSTAGEVGRLLRQVDWSRSLLGPPESWPQSLLIPLGICLRSRTSMSIWWGPDWTLLYNDAYAPLLGKKHPQAFGRPAREVWGDVWPAILPQLEAAARGESTLNERNRVPTNRNGVFEDAWFTWSYTPIFDESGAVVGSLVVCIEETAQVRRETELVDTRARLATTLNAAEIGFWSVDARTNVVVADPNLAKIFSISPEVAAAGAPLQVFTDAIHPIDRERTVKAIETALAGQDTFEAEYRLTPKEGNIRWVLARGQVSRDDQGRAHTMSGVLIDITERMRNERLLSAQNEILRLMASEASLDKVLEEIVRQMEEMSDDAVASILLVDQAGRLRPGASRQLPEDFNRALDGIEIGENVGTCGRAAAIKQPVVTLEIARDPNWAPLHTRMAELGLISAWSVPILASRGEILGTFGTYFRHRRGPKKEEVAAVDFFSKTAALVIERARAQESLQQSDDRFQQIANIMPQIVWSAGPDGVLDYYNQRWFDYIGLPATRKDEITWDQYLHPDDLAATYAAWQKAISTGENYQMEFRVRDARKNYNWFLTRALPVRNQAGAIVRWFGTCTDINDRKAAHDENLRLVERERAARLASENAGRIKDEFLATLSHELRTPLNPVLLLATEAAANATLPEAVRADFEAIARNVGLEARLIDDLLDLTRITQGKMALSIAPEDLHGTLRDALGNVAPDIAAKEIVVQTDFAASLATVSGDAVRLQQVFWNILRNAAKFTPRGGSIWIATELSPDGKRVVVRIRDSGMGMKPEEVGRIFNAFTQGDHAGGAGSHRFGGLGLGLAISRMLVELHSGRITGESAGLDRGSTFSVELPLADRSGHSPAPKVPAKNYSASPFAAGKHRRILLVEDHEPTRIALRQLLTRRHYDVSEAGTLAEALAVAGERRFDLLVTDIGLPDGDGYEVMRAIAQRQKIKGIALTGYGMEEDIQKARAAGFSSHLTKPIKVQDLDAALASLATEEDSNASDKL